MAYLFKNDANNAHYCFVHIPKTGGTTIGKVLSMYDEIDTIYGWENKGPITGHLSLTDIKGICRLQNIDFKNLITFSLVRNPYSWYVSWYHFLKVHASVDNDFSIESKWTQLSFPEFMKNIYQYRDELTFYNNGKLTPKYQQMIDWISIDRNEYVNAVFKMEDIGKWPDMLNSIGIDVTISKHERKSSHNDFRTYYDDYTIGLVAEMHSDDLKFFGYNFE